MSALGTAAHARQPRPLGSNRDFLLLWTGAGFSLLGERVAVFAYPLLIVFQGGSPADAGLVAFAALLPSLLLQIPAGVVVDRLDRRVVMITCDLLGMVAMASVGVVMLFGRLSLPHLLAAAFVEGGGVVFYRLSERAAVPNVVEPGQLSAAMSRNEARGRAAGLLGQPISSSLFALVRWAPFLFAAVGHLVALVNVLFIRRPLQTTANLPSRGLRAEIGEGIRWLLRQRFLRTAVLLVAATNILFQVLSLSLVLTIKQHGGSPALVGVIGAVSGLGGVVGALAGSGFIRRLAPGKVIIGVFGVWTVLMPVIGLTANPFVLAALFAALSFAGALMNIMAGVYQVQVTPDEMQGRVGAVAGLLSSGASSLGALVGGIVLSAVGTGRAVLGVGAAMLCLTLIAAASPAVRTAGKLTTQLDAEEVAR